MDMKYTSVTVQNDSGNVFTFYSEGRNCRIDLSQKLYKHGFLILSDSCQVMEIAGYFFGRNAKGRIRASNSEVQELKELIEKFLP